MTTIDPLVLASDLRHIADAVNQYADELVAGAPPAATSPAPAGDQDQPAPAFPPFPPAVSGSTPAPDVAPASEPLTDPAAVEPPAGQDLTDDQAAAAVEPPAGQDLPEDQVPADVAAAAAVPISGPLTPEEEETLNRLQARLEASAPPKEVE